MLYRGEKFAIMGSRLDYLAYTNDWTLTVCWGKRLYGDREGEIGGRWRWFVELRWRSITRCLKWREGFWRSPLSVTILRERRPKGGEHDVAARWPTQVCVRKPDSGETPFLPQ